MNTRAAWTWILWAGLAVVTGVAFRWITRAAASEPVAWDRDLGGYYNYLARGLAGGHLYLPIEPDPRLLRLTNPWDPQAGEAIRIHDLAYYRGRYFLYHGVGPAVMLFLPWRVLTGHDLPETAAAWLLIWGAHLCWSAALLRWLAITRREWPLATVALGITAIGFCSGLPFLLNRIFVYEVAIAGGAFAVAAGFLALTFAGWRGMAAGGLLFGLAIACRPHLGLVAIVVFLVLLRERSRRAQAAFLAPLMLVGIALAGYNYARFDDPFEFGIRYLMSGPNQNRVRLAWENVPAGLRLLGWQPPTWSPVFPWVRLAFHPHDPLPREIFLEPSVGALFLAPFLLLLIVPVRGKERVWKWTLVLAAAAVLVFIASTGWVSQRYEADFLPMAVFAAVLGFGGATSWLRTSLITLAVSYGIAVNAALAIAGPYDGMARARPASYVRLAGWFSLFDEHRLRVDPDLSIELPILERAPAGAFREVVLTLGHPSHHWTISRGRDQPGQPAYVLLESAGVEPARGELSSGEERHAWIVEYVRSRRELRVSAGGRAIAIASTGVLITAPAEIQPGPATGKLRVRISGR